MDILKEDDITIFGKTNFRGEEKPFGIKLDDRRRHMYIIGKTGMGKSVMLQNLVIQDIIKGRGVAFIDPHGDSAEYILNFIPKSRINDVVYFNPSDLENPVAFNILEAVDEDHKHLIASGMMGVFKKIWPDVWSPRMEYILNNTILALLDYPGSTMLGINRMMSDQNFRRQVVDNLKDPIVRSFWIEEFGKWDPRFMREATAAIQNKVGQFVSTPIVRHIVGQPNSTIKMREIMDQGKILIVNLAKGRIGEEAMSLLGGMVVTRLYLAAMERVDVEESTRRDFFLYVDEFQNFATESFASILSEARKYRLSLIVAHQYIAQLTEEVRDAVFGNVGTLVTFRVGAGDAEFMEKEFEPMVMMNDLINLPKYQIYLKLMIEGVTGNAFSAKSLPPFPAPLASHNNKVIKASQERYGRPRKEIEEKIHKWMEQNFQAGRPSVPGANREVISSGKDPRQRFQRPMSENDRYQRPLPPKEKYMSPSRIIGFSDRESDKVEQKIKQEIADTVEKTEQIEPKEVKIIADPAIQTEDLKEAITDTVSSLAKEVSSDVISEIVSEIKSDKPTENNSIHPDKTIDPVNPRNTGGTDNTGKTGNSNNIVDTDNTGNRSNSNTRNPGNTETTTATPPKKPPTVWYETACDRCGNNTKVPFKPEEGRGVFCKECLREVRRQRAIALEEQKEKRVNQQERVAPRNARPRVSDEQKEKLKEDLRDILAKLKSEDK